MEIEQRMDIVGKSVELEKSLFELLLPASGSIYYKDDPNTQTEAVDIVSDVAPNIFCVGSSMEYPWWHDKRDELAINNGPWKRNSAICSL
jgi:hypothetical protein